MPRSHARWQALGTYAFLATDDPRHLPAAERLAAGVLAEVDRTCSRFRDDSDLSRANRRAGRWTRVDPLLAAAVTVALEAARETAGIVDPCLGSVLVALGYDADLAVVRRRGRHDQGPAPLVPWAHDPDAWREVRVDPGDQHGAGGLLVPAGTTLDLGATAKAWAADLVAASVVDRLGGTAVLSLGGDVRLAGTDPAATWPVTVAERPEDLETDDPATGPADRTVEMHLGGLATSSTLARRWRVGSTVRHHLLDPRTGLPTAGPWRTVTATGHTATSANTATTAALVLGDAAVPWLTERGVAARLVGHDGRVQRTAGWPAPAPVPVPTRRA